MGSVLDFDGLKYFYQRYIAKLQTDVKNLASSEIRVTLAAANWTGTAAPYLYTIQNKEVTADSVIRITFPPDVTLAQAEAFGKALVTGGTQAAGSFTLRALKAKPTVDVPVIISIGGA